MSSSKYNDEVSTWLQGIKPGWRVIDEICQPQNRDMFIDAVKAYIDNAGYDVYFDTNYKKLKKIDISGFLTKTIDHV